MSHSRCICHDCFKQITLLLNHLWELSSHAIWNPQLVCWKRYYLTLRCVDDLSICVYQMHRYICVYISCLHEKCATLHSSVSGENENDARNHADNNTFHMSPPIGCMDRVPHFRSRRISTFDRFLTETCYSLNSVSNSCVCQIKYTNSLSKHRDHHRKSFQEICSDKCIIRGCGWENVTA